MAACYVESGKHHDVKPELAAILGNANMAIEDVKRVCESGYTMPQKSTYFYPKVICGFLFSSILEEEFALPSYSPFLSR